jgi:putative membrane protein
MIDSFLPLLLLIAFSMLGVLLGTITGLVPGFHPNNVAFILLAIAPMLLSELHFLDAFGISATVLVVAVILAASVAHTFLSFIPAAFIGAPEGDTALCLLPAHRLLLEGRAYESTVLSAIGSFGAVIFAFLTLIPFYFVFIELQFYDKIQGSMLYILLGISALLILTESFSEQMETYEAILLSSFVFILSGLFGYVILDMPSTCLFQSSLLFPALTGLFGLSTILYSLFHTPEIPEQMIEEPEIEKGETVKSIIFGSTLGSFVSFLPGITSAHATVMAMLVRRNREPEQVITTLSGVNTANVIFCLATLYLIFRARSGATIAISHLLQVQAWEMVIPPLSLIYLLIAALIAAAFSFFITKYMGKQFSLLFTKLPYRKLLIGIICFLFALVSLFTGALGLLTLLVATCIGLVPIHFGIRRSNCMGVLLLPIIIRLWLLYT